jgi:hypothetical protein
MSKHTPGPWMVGTASGHNCNIVYTQHSDKDDDFNGVCSVYGLPLQLHKRDFADLHDRWTAGLANARLISAAPELYEALSDLVAHLNQGAYSGDVMPPEHPMHKAAAALNKAKGE